MFNTLSSFSVVYFALAAVLFILVLFEKHFIQLEDRAKAKKKNSVKSTKVNSVKKPVQRISSASSQKSNCSKSLAIRRIPNNAA